MASSYNKKKNKSPFIKSLIKRFYNYFYLFFIGTSDFHELRDTQKQDENLKKMVENMLNL